MAVWCLMSMARGDVGCMFGEGVKGIEERKKEKKRKGKKKAMNSLPCPSLPNLWLFAKLC